MKSKVEKVKIGDAEIVLKKDFLGWRVIHPWKNPDGSWNWENFIAGGSWYKLIFTIIIVAVIVGVIFEYVSQLKLLTSCLTALNDSVILIP
jgi:hypothetical protein